MLTDPPEPVSFEAIVTVALALPSGAMPHVKAGVVAPATDGVGETNAWRWLTLISVVSLAGARP